MIAPRVIEESKNIRESERAISRSNLSVPAVLPSCRSFHSSPLSLTLSFYRFPTDSPPLSILSQIDSLRLFIPPFYILSSLSYFFSLSIHTLSSLLAIYPSFSSHLSLHILLSLIVSLSILPSCQPSQLSFYLSLSPFPSLSPCPNFFLTNPPLKLSSVLVQTRGPSTNSEWKPLHSGKSLPSGKPHRVINEVEGY